MKKLHASLLLLGCAFLACLVWKIGAGRLWGELVSIGWGLVPFIAFEFLAEGFHTKGWSLCLDEAYRRLSWFRLFRIRLAGNAINYLTPTAAMGGEVTKAALLSATLRGPGAVSGVLVGRLSAGVAQALFVAFGSVFVVWDAKLPRPAWVAMFASAGFVIGGIVTFMLLQRYGKLGAFVRWLAARPFAGRRLRWLASEISGVDEALKKFYREGPRAFALSVGWQLAGHSIGLAQTGWFLSLIHQPFSLQTMATVWVLGLWFDLLTFAVPLNMGTLEGSRIVAFKAAGMGALAGMTYGLALRLAQLSVVCFGLISYALFIKSTSHSRKRGRVLYERGTKPPIPEPTSE